MGGLLFIIMDIIRRFLIVLVENLYCKDDFYDENCEIS